jgi:hypothetical protein
VFPRAPDGSYTVEGVGAMKWRSIAGTSLGACNNGGPDDGATIGAGVKVRQTEDLVFVVTGGILNAHADCSSFCDAPSFVQTVFGPGATLSYFSDLWDYRSDCNGSWVGSFPNRDFAHGQEAGDITGPKTTC